MEKSNLVPPSIYDALPAMVRNELAQLTPEKQEEFLEEYKRKAKSTGVAYLLILLCWCHYAYLRHWGIQILFWLTLGGFWVWLVIDLFRIPSLIKSYNQDVAIDALRNLKMISK